MGQCGVRSLSGHGHRVIFPFLCTVVICFLPCLPEDVQIFVHFKQVSCLTGDEKAKTHTPHRTSDAAPVSKNLDDGAETPLNEDKKPNDRTLGELATYHSDGGRLSFPDRVTISPDLGDEDLEALAEESSQSEEDRHDEALRKAAGGKKIEEKAQDGMSRSFWFMRRRRGKRQKFKGLFKDLRRLALTLSLWGAGVYVTRETQSMKGLMAGVGLSLFGMGKSFSSALRTLKTAFRMARTASAERKVQRLEQQKRAQEELMKRRFLQREHNHYKGKKKKNHFKNE